MEAAFKTLDDTVSTINEKILNSTQMVKEYKRKIMEKLEELLNQINMLKEDSKNSPVPQLRQQLQDSQAALASKTTELETAQAQLAELRSKLESLGQNVIRLQNEQGALVDKLKQLEELKGSNNNKDAEIAALKVELSNVNNQKNDAEQKLAAAQQDLGDFIGRIGAINTRLAEEITKIDTILADFGDGSDVTDKIAAIGTNLASIIQIINNPEQRGGRRKTKKMRGGYLYSKKTNSNSSSISSSKSKSKSKSNNSNSRRKKRLLNF